MSEYQLGSEVFYKNKGWRIVRIVANDQSLFEDDDHEPYVILESYVQIKSVDGEIDHLVLSSDKLPFTGFRSNIKALKPLARSNNV